MEVRLGPYVSLDASFTGVVCGKRKALLNASRQKGEQRVPGVTMPGPRACREPTIFPLPCRWGRSPLGVRSKINITKHGFKGVVQVSKNTIIIRLSYSLFIFLILFFIFCNNPVSKNAPMKYNPFLIMGLS